MNTALTDKEEIKISHHIKVITDLGQEKSATIAQLQLLKKSRRGR